MRIIYKTSYVWSECMDNKEAGKRLRNTRKMLKLSETQMGSLVGKKDRAIISYETGERSAPLEYLHALCVGCSVNLNYIVTGDGEMFLHEEKPIERKVPENYAAYWLHDWGEVRLFGLQKYFDYSTEVMADIMDITVPRYLELITKNPFPKEKEANAIMDNFSGFTLDEILYDRNKTFMAKLEKKESDKIEIDLQSLPLEKRLKITALLKEP